MKKQERITSAIERNFLVIMSAITCFSIIRVETMLIISAGGHITMRGYLTFTLQILLFYSIQYWAFPKTISYGNLRSFTIRLVCLISGYIFIRGTIAFHGRSVALFFIFLLSSNQLAFVLTHLLYLLPASISLGIFNYIIKLKQESIQELSARLMAEQEKSKIENAAAQLRLNPHLTMNTLNFIKAVKDHPTKIEQAIDLYAPISRHYMTDITKQRVLPLREELNQVKNQVALYTILSDGEAYIELEEIYNGNNDEVQIAPATILTLIENINTHGIINDPDYPAKIWIEWTKAYFYFKSKNYKKRNSRPGSGIGLKSIKNTLNYYYPSQHQLQISDEEDAFTLTLKIEL